MVPIRAVFSLAFLAVICSSTGPVAGSSTAPRASSSAARPDTSTVGKTIEQLCAEYLIAYQEANHKRFPASLQTPHHKEMGRDAFYDAVQFAVQEWNRRVDEKEAELTVLEEQEHERTTSESRSSSSAPPPASRSTNSALKDSLWSLGQIIADLRGVKLAALTRQRYMVRCRGVVLRGNGGAEQDFYLMQTPDAAHGEADRWHLDAMQRLLEVLPVVDAALPKARNLRERIHFFRKNLRLKENIRALEQMQSGVSISRQEEAGGAVGLGTTTTNGTSQSQSRMTAMKKLFDHSDSEDSSCNGEDLDEQLAEEEEDALKLLVIESQKDRAKELMDGLLELLENKGGPARQDVEHQGAVPAAAAAAGKSAADVRTDAELVSTSTSGGFLTRSTAPAPSSFEEMLAEQMSAWENFLSADVGVSQQQTQKFIDEIRSYTSMLLAPVPLGGGPAGGSSTTSSGGNGKVAPPSKQALKRNKQKLIGLLNSVISGRVAERQAEEKRQKERSEAMEAQRKTNAELDDALLANSNYISLTRERLEQDIYDFLKPFSSADEEIDFGKFFEMRKPGAKGGAPWKALYAAAA